MELNKTGFRVNKKKNKKINICKGQPIYSKLDITYCSRAVRKEKVVEVS